MERMMMDKTAPSLGTLEAVTSLLSLGEQSAQRKILIGMTAS